MRLGYREDIDWLRAIAVLAVVAFHFEAPAVFGGFVGGWLDAWLGAKRSVQVEIGISLIGVFAILGMSPDTIFFFWHYDPAAHAPLWN